MMRNVTVILGWGIVREGKIAGKDFVSIAGKHWRIEYDQNVFASVVHAFEVLRFITFVENTVDDFISVEHAICTI